MYRKERTNPAVTTLVISALALALGGCLESEEGESWNRNADPDDPSANSAPLISGIPSTDIAIGEVYSFIPTATDPDGDTLTFSVENKPAWADFNSESGELSGQLALGTAGDYRDIRISVSDGNAKAHLPRFSIRVAEDSTPTGNTAPVISGMPPSTATADYFYDFVPSASDPDGDSLTFSVQNLPSWASFDTRTGEFSGKPRLSDVGTFSNILVSVSDGKDTTSLRAFAITVEEMGVLSATLSWTPPTQNEDGSQLVDLAGYKIYWGNRPGNYTKSATINNPGMSSYVVENLPAGTLEFVATSFNDDGIESDYSNPIAKVVN